MKLLIFAGTTEGHALCRFVSAGGGQAEAFVATEYGEQVMEPLPGITVHTGRLDEDAMAERMTDGALVVDATHPYAAAVTRTIRAACERTGARYLRLARAGEIGAAEGLTDLTVVPDTAAAVAWLNARPGLRALLTTGSKELEAYTQVSDYAERLCVRVLPTASVLQKCEALGFPGRAVYAMQGPFSHEMNVALLRTAGAQVLVTKDTGGAGGFAEKLSAARQTGAAVLVIARPADAPGLPLEAVERELTRVLGLRRPAVSPGRFPLFISLEGRPVLLVGAGKIAARRAEVLCRFGAQVTLVAPEQRAEFPSEVRWLARAYAPGDEAGMTLAVAATDDRAVNHAVYAACEAAGIPVSVADCAAESTFFFPAICRGGGLTAGVVSDGRAHHATAHAAARIRTLLEEEANG